MLICRSEPKNIEMSIKIANFDPNPKLTRAEKSQNVDQNRKFRPKFKAYASRKSRKFNQIANFDQNSKLTRAENLKIAIKIANFDQN